MTLQGSQPLAVLLCKFKDEASEPHPAAYYRDLLKRGTGGLNDYWIAASLNAINLDGSAVFGWRVLDVDRATFLGSGLSRDDKIHVARHAFKDAELARFPHVIAAYNADVLDGGAYGDGVLANVQDHNVTFLAHETGHLYNIEHSFDLSDRVIKPGETQEGEYYDRHDIMSAMNVKRDSGHRFSPRGPLLNAANLERMGWLPADRIWRPLKNSSGFAEVDIVALEHPEVRGYLAAQVGGWIAEFRMPSGFDAGLDRPAVLFHDYPANPNSFVIASDPSTDNHEWLPGQVYWNPVLFNKLGGIKATVLGFDLEKKTARLLIATKAFRPPMVDLKTLLALGIGQLPIDGFILVLKDGKIVPVPVPEPDLVPIAPVLNPAILGALQQRLDRPQG